MADLDLTEAVDAVAQALREAGWDYDPHSLPPTPENLAAAAVAVAAPIIAAQVRAEIRALCDDHEATCGTHYAPGLRWAACALSDRFRAILDRP